MFLLLLLCYSVQALFATHGNHPFIPRSAVNNGRLRPAERTYFEAM